MQHSRLDPVLIRKYNKPVPRYTSYPTVPNWHEKIDKGRWLELFSDSFHANNPGKGISLYVHLPFCESLCTYCGCNKKITGNHSVEEEYIAAIEKEWLLYRSTMKQVPVIQELHLGGGTPTFFSPENLERLTNFILNRSIRHPNYDFSIEGHPNNTTEDHLKLLLNAGFRRISYGIQGPGPGCTTNDQPRSAF
ncbi:MAG: radical SAM protein [Chitinophagaceae bacterium]